MTEQFTTKDSGDRRVFDTGAQRDMGRGKGRWDLLPLDMIERDAQLLERGALKYGDNNWQKGIPLTAFLDSAFRHLSQLARGDRSEDHAAAVRWNVAGLEWTRREILVGRLPVSLSEGTVFDPRSPGTAEIARLESLVPNSPKDRPAGECRPVDDCAQRPDENAKQHRDRVNRPWSDLDLEPSRFARQPDDFSHDAL